MGFFSKLRERRIVQIVLSYAGAAWVVLEVTDQLVGNAKLPELAYTIVLIWVLVGFPAALLVGWHHGEKGEQKAPLSEIAALVVLLLVGAGFTGSALADSYRRMRAAEAAAGNLSLQRIAVAYFHDLGGGEDQYLADALTEDLITELNQVRALDVVSRNGTLPFRGADVPPDSIARVLRAGSLVEGTIERRRDDRIRVNLVLRQGEQGAPVDRASFEVRRDQFDEMRQSLATETARLLRGRIGAEIRLRESSAGAANTTVWGLSQRAEKIRKDAEALLLQGDLAGAWAAFDSADATLAQAHQLDDRWTLLPIQRAGIAYRRARLSQGSPPDAVQFVEETVRHAETALQLEPSEPRALELRGTALYYQYLLNVTTDASERDALLERARRDLEAAVSIDRSLASAHATLSHLYFQDNNMADAVLAASRAYEEDAYLEQAELVIVRLFNASLNLGNFRSARQWCDEGRSRFPNDFRFTSCRLTLMSTPGIEAAALNIDSAWALHAQVESMTPARRQAFEVARAGLTVGGVIGRVAMRDNNTALRDSARAVLNRSLAGVTESVDPTQELLIVEAYMRILAGQKDRAIDLLARVAASDQSLFTRNPGGVEWWWSELSGEPRFRRLAGLD